MSTKRISITHKIEGVLADYSTLPVLRDPTLAFGVKRTDTSAVVVAAGTEFVRDSLGVYHYDVTGLTEGVEYLAYVERVNAGGGTQRDAFLWTAGEDEAEGYYVDRGKVLRTAGTDNFNAAFNLDNEVAVADEDVVQEVFDQADRFVDTLAKSLGVEKATATHYVATTHEDFGSISDWASRWARAQGYLLRGTTGDQGATAEGQMAAMKEEAERWLKEIFSGMVPDDEEPGGFSSVERVRIRRTRDEYSR